MLADASERLLQHMRCERHWMVGRSIFPPLRLLSADTRHLARPYSASPQQAGRVLCRPAGGALQEVRPCEQSPESLRLLGLTLAGELDAAVSVARSQFGDGRLMETLVHTWVSDWEQHADGTRTPLYLVSLINTGETVCID